MKEKKRKQQISFFFFLSFPFFFLFWAMKTLTKTIPDELTRFSPMAFFWAVTVDRDLKLSISRWRLMESLCVLSHVWEDEFIYLWMLMCVICSSLFGRHGICLG